MPPAPRPRVGARPRQSAAACRRAACDPDSPRWEELHDPMLSVQTSNNQPPTRVRAALTTPPSLRATVPARALPYGGAGPSPAGSTRLDATRRRDDHTARRLGIRETTSILCSVPTPRRRLSSALCRLGMSSRCRLLATLTCAAIGASAESVPTIDAHRAGWKGTKAIASPPRGRRGSSMGRPRSNCGAARRRHARILPATAKR